MSGLEFFGGDVHLVFLPECDFVCAGGFDCGLSVSCVDVDSDWFGVVEALADADDSTVVFASTKFEACVHAEVFPAEFTRHRLGFHYAPSFFGG
ncbi:hypothetical protein ABZ820_33440 [Streptomyces diacarni]|uniref:hypothetical protein n=1 Tax=Streptomyces diacarni TaxID=2800381 RepID=UPI0034095E7C